MENKYDITGIGQKQIDHTGKKFGKWTVLGFAGRRDYNHKCYAYYWRCKCDCGLEKDVMAASLIPGKSLGCAKCASRQAPAEGSVPSGRKKSMLEKLFG